MAKLPNARKHVIRAHDLPLIARALQLVECKNLSRFSTGKQILTVSCRPGESKLPRRRTTRKSRAAAFRSRARATAWLRTVFRKIRSAAPPGKTNDAEEVEAIARRYDAAVGVGPCVAFAATVNAGGGYTLVDAITSANTDTATGGCRDGSGADTLVLPAGSTQTLTVVNNAGNGLPVVTSAIIIQGNGSTIRRAPIAPPFRIFNVAAGVGRLTLQATSVAGGSAGVGGRLLNSGTAILAGSTLLNNTATTFGAGASNRPNVPLSSAIARSQALPLARRAAAFLTSNPPAP
jgi:hypothetical protein